MECLPHFLNRKNFVNNLGQNIWNKVNISNEIEQYQKTLISTFAHFLTAIAKVQFLEGREGKELYLHPNSNFSSLFQFPKILKPFENSRGNSYTKFVILYLKFRFTYGKADLHQNAAVKFQNILTRTVGRKKRGTQKLIPVRNQMSEAFVNAE